MLIDEDSGPGGDSVAMAATAGEFSSEPMSSSPEPASPSSDVVDVEPLIRPSIIVATRSKLDRKCGMCGDKT